MGGPGSGNWFRWQSKGKTEECCRIDIRNLNRNGWLRPGSTNSLQWSRGGEPSGNIRYRVEPSRLVLMYRSRSHGDEWEDVEESVYLDRTACNYGGYRQWFLCPGRGCGHRVAVLYAAGKYFLCRHCYDLAYSSQHESTWDRASRKSRKIVQRLGGDPDDSHYPEKPKGMRWKTYERLLDKAEYYDQLSWSMVAKWAKQMMG